MTAINDILTSPNDERPTLRVVGADGSSGRWVVEEVELSDGPRLLEDEEAAAYGVTDAPVKGDESRGWKRLAQAHTDSLQDARRILRDRPLTPSQALEANAGSPVTFQRDGKVYTAGTEEAAEVEGQPQRWQPLTFTDDATFLRPSRRRDDAPGN